MGGYTNSNFFAIKKKKCVCIFMSQIKNNPYSDNFVREGRGVLDVIFLVNNRCVYVCVCGRGGGLAPFPETAAVHYTVRNHIIMGTSRGEVANKPYCLICGEDKPFFHTIFFLNFFICNL